MSKLFNLAKMTTATSGTGTITLGSAVSGFLSFADAGVSDGDIVSYGISDGANSEVGYGTYTAAGTTLARTTVLKSTNSDAAIALSGTAVVFITALQENLTQDGWIPAEAWTYASADDPTYTFTLSAFDATTKYSPGMRIKLTQSTGGTKFAIITKVVFDDPGSTITAYFGTDYNLENEAISSPYYSREKAPFGFPLDPTKWTVITSDTSDRSQATPTSGIYYNLGTLSISIPIGIWSLDYQVVAHKSYTSIIGQDINVALSTANNSVSDNDLLIKSYSHSTDYMFAIFRQKTVSIATKTPYYLIMSTPNGGASVIIHFRGDYSNTIIRAVCAYL